jgi:hypothetical protein
VNTPVGTVDVVVVGGRHAGRPAHVPPLADGDVEHAEQLDRTEVVD